MKKCHSVEQRSPLCKVGVIQHVLVDPRIGSFQAWLNTLRGFIRELNGRLLKYIEKKCGALFPGQKKLHCVNLISLFISLFQGTVCSFIVLKRVILVVKQNRIDSKITKYNRIE